MSVTWNEQRKCYQYRFRLIPAGSTSKERFSGTAPTEKACEIKEREHWMRLMHPERVHAEPAPTPTKPTGNGSTLREGMQAHVARMRKRDRAERSIVEFEAELTRHMSVWLDRPFTDITTAVLDGIHDDIKRRTARVTGSNPDNPKGAPTANRVIKHVSACWESLNVRLQGALGSWNPARGVDLNVLKPKRERIAAGDLPGYVARIDTMTSPIRRDGLMFALYTGLRRDDVCTVRFEHVDWKEHTLRVPSPKGGESCAFTIPLSAAPMAILKRRKKDNTRDLGGADIGAIDGGWTFPCRDDAGKVGALRDLRQQMSDGGVRRRFPTEDVHTLRRTWQSIAHEEGVSELDQHVLSNHAYGSHNVNATYIAQHLDHLATCAAKIEAGITRRIDGRKRVAR